MLKAIQRILHGDNDIDTDEYNKDIEESELEITLGKYTTHQALIEKMKEW